MDDENTGQASKVKPKLSLEEADRLAEEIMARERKARAPWIANALAASEPDFRVSWNRRDPPGHLSVPGELFPWTARR